jgi:hypothetical protein
MTLHFDIDLGTNTLKGIFTLEAKALIVEWRRYSMMEAPVGDLESLSIPYTDIEDITVALYKIRRPVIEIIAKKATSFGSMPLPAGKLSVLKARIVRSDRSKAEGWGAEAYLRVADATDDKEALPDKSTK